jgi:hypothetical protein
VTAAGRAISAALGSPFGVGNSLYHCGTESRIVGHIPFGSYPVALVRDLGGWDERLIANEDYEFDYRLRQQGYELLFDPSLSISWVARQSPGPRRRDCSPSEGRSWPSPPWHPTRWPWRWLLSPRLASSTIR